MVLPEMTPALYGIAEEIPCPLIKKEIRKFIRKILDQEEELIYPAAFRAYALKFESGINKKRVFKVFSVLLEDELEAEHQQDILEAVFSSYWVVVENTAYWQANQFESRKSIEYDKALKKWRDDYQPRIQLREGELKRCVGKT